MYSPSEGRLLGLTANRRVCETRFAAAARWEALVQILANEKPRLKPARSADREIGLATFRPQFEHFSNFHWYRSLERSSSLFCPSFPFSF